MANDDVRDLLTALSAVRTKFLVVGAYALAHHGLVRATGDMQIAAGSTTWSDRLLVKVILAPDVEAGVGLPRLRSPNRRTSPTTASG